MDNSGEKSRNDSPIDSALLTWTTADKVPHVGNTKGNPGATPNLRGVEANTNKDKGTPCNSQADPGTRGGQLDECC